MRIVKLNFHVPRQNLASFWWRKLKKTACASPCLKNRSTLWPKFSCAKIPAKKCILFLRLGLSKGETLPQHEVLCAFSAYECHPEIIKNWRNGRLIRFHGLWDFKATWGWFCSRAVRLQCMDKTGNFGGYIAEDGPFLECSWIWTNVSDLWSA